MSPDRPRLEFFVVAESYAVDQDSGRLSIFNVLEKLTSSGKAAALTRLTAISEWILPAECIGEDFMTTLLVHSPTRRAFKEMKLGFTGRTRRHRLFQNILGMLLREEGRWLFELQLDGEHVASHEMDVELNQPSALRLEDLRPWEETKA